MRAAFLAAACAGPRAGRLPFTWGKKVATSQSSYVFADTGARSELERLETLESVFDPDSRRLLGSTGLGPGWRCLEVGAGAGSIATWLAGEVGPSGEVVAVDTNSRFLRDKVRPGLRVLEGDIRTVSLEPGTFDLVHARFLLIHVAQWQAALQAMLRAVGPGGFLVLEEPDFSASRATAGRDELRVAFERVHRAIESMFRRRGLDFAFGQRIPGLLAEGGLAAVRVENAAPVCQGGSPMARMMGLSTRQLRDKYLATGQAQERDLELYDAFTLDPGAWGVFHGTIRGVGQKPVP